VISSAVIVGSSVAGVRAAQALRTEGFDGRIVLVGQEADWPYDKPPLSKQFLSGAWDGDRICLLTRETAARDRIEMRLGVAASSLDAGSHRVVLADNSVLDYDVVVIATGASARPAPWKPEQGMHVLRTVQDSRNLHAEFKRGGPVVIVGGGFIGAEAAATARSLGNAVTVVDPLEAPIGRVVGREVGAYFTGLHHRNGVATRFGQGVAGIERRADGDLGVLLTDGSVLSAATVLVGIGAVPNDGWLAGSGVLTDNGVVCDEYCRSVNVPDVFAAGDVASWIHVGHGERVRAEHWTNAVEQAASVAHNIVHPDNLCPYRSVEYVWSDQYSWKVQIAGRPDVATRHEAIGDLAGDHPKAAVLYTDSAGILRGVVTVNWPRASAHYRRLLADGVSFAEALAALPAPAGTAR
jgi:phthalate 3,4-dioxygenase ferredoxin reductase component